MNERRGKKSKLGLVLLCVLPVVAIVFFWWRQGQAPVGGTPFRQLPTAEQEQRRAHLGQVEDQIKDIQRKVKKNEKAPFELVITEDDLNTFLQDRINTEKFPFREPRAGFSPGRITVQGTVDYKGFSAPGSLSGTLTVENGQPAFHAESLKVQGFPAPGNLKEKAEKEINKVARTLTEDSVKLESATIEVGKITLRGTTE
jgi:hypothetical protein